MDEYEEKVELIKLLKTGCGGRLAGPSPVTSVSPFRDYVSNQWKPAVGHFIPQLSSMTENI